MENDLRIPSSCELLQNGNKKVVSNSGIEVIKDSKKTDNKTLCLFFAPRKLIINLGIKTAVIAIMISNKIKISQLLVKDKLVKYNQLFFIFLLIWC